MAGPARHTERGNRLFKFLDRYAGVPAAAVLGLLRRSGTTTLPRPPRRIGLLRTAAIGDTILMSGPIQDLKKQFPVCELTLFTGSSNFEAAGLIDGVDHLLRIPISNPLKAGRIIRSAGRFDAWVDFGQWPRLDALLSRFADAGLKVGFSTPGQYRHYVYDVPVPHSKDVHEVDNFRSLLMPLGVTASAAPRIHLPDAAPLENKVALHMFPGGARAAVKSWPAQNWVDLADRLTSEGHRVVFTGSPANRENAQTIVSMLADPEVAQVAAGERDLRETARLLLTCRAVVSVDTGIMHLASALGCPLVSLHGPTLVRRWGPLGSRSIGIQSPVPRLPVIHLGFEGAASDNSSMRAITVDAVMHELRTLLSRPSVGGPA